MYVRMNARSFDTHCFLSFSYVNGMWISMRTYTDGEDRRKREREMRMSEWHSSRSLPSLPASLPVLCRGAHKHVRPDERHNRQTGGRRDRGMCERAVQRRTGLLTRVRACHLVTDVGMSSLVRSPVHTVTSVIHANRSDMTCVPT